MKSLQKKLFLLTTYYLLLTTFIGCARITETVKGIAGVSTKILEDNRKTAVTKTVDYDYFTCYTETLKALTEIGAYVYAKDMKKGMIAIYISETDTTPVGVFFKEIDQTHTQIEVSSPSRNAKEVIAARLFSLLEKSLNPENKGTP